MASATYEIITHNSPTGYKLSGVAKVRVRANMFWFWDEADRVLLLTPTGNVALINRADIDAGTADDGVFEVRRSGSLPDSPAVHRISGVTSLKMKEGTAPRFSGFIEFWGENKKLPQALVNDWVFTIWSTAAIVTTG